MHVGALKEGLEAERIGPSCGLDPRLVDPVHGKGSAALLSILRIASKSMRFPSPARLTFPMRVSLTVPDVGFLIGYAFGDRLEPAIPSTTIPAALAVAIDEGISFWRGEDQNPTGVNRFGEGARSKMQVTPHP